VSGIATDHVSRVSVHGVRAIAFAGAVAVAVGSGTLLHATTTPPVLRGDLAFTGARPAPALPSVPPAPAIPDVPWLTERGDGAWIYGRGSGLSAELPAGETGLAIDDGLVASTRAGAGGHSIVRLRDVPTGAVVADVELPIWVSAGAWTSGGLVVTGYRDATMTSDGGLMLVDPDQRSARSLVDASVFAKALGVPVARGEVVVSPSGRWAASNACGVRLCETQVVDVSTGQIFRPLRSAEGFLRVITDDAIVTTDDDATWISARRIRDGGEAWRETNSVLLDPLAIAGGSVVGVVGSPSTGWAIGEFDARGRRHDLTPRSGPDQPWPRIWREVSTPTRAVIASRGFDGSLPDLSAPPISILDLPDVSSLEPAAGDPVTPADPATIPPSAGPEVIR
jgi:hypothetical protein